MGYSRSLSRLAFTIAWGALSLCAGPTQWGMAATTYSVTNLGDLPGGTDRSLGLRINASGQIVGSSFASTGERAFLWTPTTPNGTTGSMIDLGDLPGELDLSRGKGINDAGQVTGWSGAIPGGSINGNRAFLWTPTTPNGTTGSMIDLGPLPGASDGSLGFAINASGQVAGESANDQGFLWTPTTPNGTTGSMAPLGSLPGAPGSPNSHGLGINAAGQVTGDSSASTGRRAFLWTPGTPNGATGSMADLGDLPGGNDRSFGMAINASGQVAGYSGATTGERAFLWTPGTPNGATGSMIDLGDLPGGLDQSEGIGINDAGKVVGWSRDATGLRAFIWSSSDGMLDLNTLLDASGAGWTLDQGYGINTLGQITGFGLYDPDGPDGIAAVTRGFLLTPVVPEPGGLSLLGIGALAVRRRRR